MLPIEIVAVGASLGGLHAVQTLLRGIPPDFACSVVLAQHRRPDPESRLCELLGGFSKLPVIEPEDRTPLRASHVYVAPGDYHLLVERGVLSLSVDPPVMHARPSIDVLFESVADAYGAASIGVVLTSSNEDGSRGAAAIKRAGGKVLVQDPATAESPVGPRAAIAATAVDAVLALEQIPGLLARLCAKGPRRERR